MKNQTNRVVVTGMGVVSPLGCSVTGMFNRLLAGKTHFHLPENFVRTYEGALHLISTVSEDYTDACTRFGTTPDHNLSSFCLLACKQALSSAGLDSKMELLFDADLHIGTSESYSFNNLDYSRCSPQEVEAYLEGKYPADTLADLANKLDIHGEALLFPIACSGGNVAIATGTKKIKYGQKKICIVGSVDCLTEKTYTTFHCLGALSTTSCKPFDQNRDGITVGEGAGFLVLEELNHALERGAPILAEILGYNICCDAHHLTTPDIQGVMASESMRKTLLMAGKAPRDISYISPHGTGTYSNDLQEANAIYQIFGEQGKTVPISAIKSMLGHCMASASALEAIVATLSIQYNQIPETIHTKEVDETFPCKLRTTDYSSRPVATVLSNSFAFGGNICSLILAKTD